MIPKFRPPDDRYLPNRNTPPTNLPHNPPRKLQPVFANLESIPTVDSFHLLKSISNEVQIRPEHLEWYLNQSILLGNSHLATNAHKKTLEILTLLAYSKVSSLGEKDIEELEIQSSPLFSGDLGYHRVTRNPLLEKVNEALSESMGLNPWEAQFIGNDLVKEVFSREYPHPGLNLNIQNLNMFEELVVRLFKEAEKGNFPNYAVPIDISQLIKHCKSNEIPLIMAELESLFFKKLSEFSNFSNIPKTDIADKIMSKLQIIAFKKFRSEDRSFHAFLTPDFLIQKSNRYKEDENQLISRPPVWNKSGHFAEEIYSLISRTGYRITPEEAKAAYVSLTSIETILKEQNIPIVQLATAGNTIPQLFTDYETFLAQPILEKFRNLGSAKNAAPYLKVLPEATTRLLEGLKPFLVHEKFNEGGINDLLQISYFRMIHAMGEAIFRKDNLLEFNNHLEVIHQEIQTLLAIIAPYKKHDFEKAVMENMTLGPNSVIPEGIEVSGVHLKPSAMHSLESVLSSVEALKGTNHLNVSILKESYYNENQTLKYARTYNCSVLTADKIAKKHISDAFEKTPKDPIDVLITEFHHNILHDTQTYNSVNVLRQVKSLVKNQLVAKNFTIVIDNTIDIENSNDMRKFLADPLIIKLIEKGHLNVVFLRSAQKFDMLGMDNYYGGITVSINNRKHYKKFNARMDHKDDQLQGINYQGLTHIQKCCAEHSNRFRKGIMDNTQKLYAMLPQKAIYSSSSINPMQISKIEDEKMFFLDIKFPQYPKSAAVISSTLIKYAKMHDLPLTMRASFGFSNTTLTVIDGKKIRLNVGLENEDDLKIYASFFDKVQHIIDEELTSLETTNSTPTAIDQSIASKIKNLIK